MTSKLTSATGIKSAFYAGARHSTQSRDQRLAQRVPFRLQRIELERRDRFGRFGGR
jgi:hypothetical protein